MAGNSTIEVEALGAAGRAEDDAAWASLPATDEAILRMRQSVIQGQHWFEALLDAVGRWRVPEETIGERSFCYLILGEAFDWLLLAERLIDEMPDLVPARGSEALLFDNRWPIDVEEPEFAERRARPNTART